MTHILTRGDYSFFNKQLELYQLGVNFIYYLNSLIFGYSQFLCLSTVTSEAHAWVQQEAVTHYTAYLSDRKNRRMFLPPTQAFTTIKETQGPDLVLNQHDLVVS